MTDPLAPASMAASGDRPRLPSIGATKEAAVITPTVVEPVIILPMMPITKGSKIAGKPYSLKNMAMKSTAGVPLRIDEKC